MRFCLNCQSGLDIVKVRCGTCNLSLEGNFALPRLARLTPESTHLAEIFLRTGGNLKVTAEMLQISYPTLRKRVDAMMAEFEALLRQDEVEADRLLRSVEQGHLSPEEAARIGRERHGLQ